MDVSAAGFTDMQVTAAGETGEYFLHGIFKHLPFSIQLSHPADYHDADFVFVAHTMNRASAYRQDAELFLQNILAENPGALGVPEGDSVPDGPLLSLPEFMFYEGSSWSIVFRESPLPLPSRTAYSLTFVVAKLLVLRIYPAQKKYDKP